MLPLHLAPSQPRSNPGARPPPPNHRLARAWTQGPPSPHLLLILSRSFGSSGVADQAASQALLTSHLVLVPDPGHSPREEPASAHPAVMSFFIISKDEPILNSVFLDANKNAEDSGSDTTPTPKDPRHTPNVGEQPPPPISHATNSAPRDSSKCGSLYRNVFCNWF